MRALRQHPLRVSGRLLALVGWMLLFLLDYVGRVVLRPRIPRAQARARWLQACCRRTLRVLEVTVATRGSVPDRGLIASNHLGYLDVVVLSSITPVVFVAKRDVRHWPVFGWFAWLANTLFVDRTRRGDVARLNRELAEVLGHGVPVVLFAEGTSSDGQRVLPFKSALLEPALQSSHPLWAALVRYEVADGLVGRDVCYWGDMTLVPHLINLVSKRRVQAIVSFAAIDRRPTHRKDLARRLHTEVVRLKDEAAGQLG
jgi:1-acyl-sn-glycerol-3-phosphate acyltransferase